MYSGQSVLSPFWKRKGYTTNQSKICSRKNRYKGNIHRNTVVCTQNSPPSGTNATPIVLWNIRGGPATWRPFSETIPEAQRWAGMVGWSLCPLVSLNCLLSLHPGWPAEWRVQSSSGWHNYTAKTLQAHPWLAFQAARLRNPQGQRIPSHSRVRKLAPIRNQAE